MNDLIKNHLSDDAVFHDGQQVACNSCHTAKEEGLCVFPQKLGGKTVTGKQVKEAVQRLTDHGCKFCGSAPIWEGNDVNQGEITVNYVTHGCIKHGSKIC
jgi:cytochrome c peroxidase